MSEKTKLLKRTSSNGYGAVSSKNVPDDLLPVSRYGVLWRWAYFVDHAAAPLLPPSLSFVGWRKSMCVSVRSMFDSKSVFS